MEGVQLLWEGPVFYEGLEFLQLSRQEQASHYSHIKAAENSVISNELYSLENVIKLVLKLRKFVEALGQDQKFIKQKVCQGLVLKLVEDALVSEEDRFQQVKGYLLRVLSVQTQSNKRAVVQVLLSMNQDFLSLTNTLIAIFKFLNFLKSCQVFLLADLKNFLKVICGLFQILILLLFGLVS